MTIATAAPALVHYLASNAHAWGGPVLVDCNADLRIVGGTAAWDGAEVTCPACLDQMRAYLPASRLLALGIA